MRLHTLFTTLFFSISCIGQIKFEQVASGYRFNCAKSERSELWCWGTDSGGQFGTGGKISSELPILVYKNSKIRIQKIYAKMNRMCALFENGRVKCWGNNERGRLGLGTTAKNVGNRSGESIEALPYLELGGEAKKIALGGLFSGFNGRSHSCAILENGKLKCWGDNESGQLGLGDTLPRGKKKSDMGDALPYVQIEGEVKDVCLGHAHTCAIHDDAKVSCWGAGRLLGNESPENVGTLPNQMGTNLKQTNLGDVRAMKIACGSSHTCVITEKGRVKCWGSNYIYDSNEYGLLGLETQVKSLGWEKGTMGNNLPFVDLGALKAEALSLGDDFSCILLENGSVKCWGHGAYLGLGLSDLDWKGGKSGDMGENLPPLNLGKFAIVDSLSSGLRHTCVVLANGQIKCWGKNLVIHLSTHEPNYGIAGNGSQINTIGSESIHMGDNLLPIKPLVP